MKPLESTCLLQQDTRLLTMTCKTTGKANGIMRFLFLLFFLCLLNQSLCAQCLSFPLSPSCSPPGGFTLVSGASINAAQTYTFSGSAAYPSLTLNGGTLIVCGNLSLSSISVNSGTIIIQPGAVFTVSNGGSALVFGANTVIYNYGKIDFRMSIVTGANNLIINCLSTSLFSVTFDQFVLQGPNTFFVNNGLFDSSYFIVQSTNSPNPICLGTGSIIKTSTMINQYSNSFYTPLGSAACVNVVSNVINNSQVTSSTGVHICIPPTISVITSPNWGAATMQTNCSGCSVLLPSELISFTGSVQNTHALLSWQTASERNTCWFLLERSDDAIVFEPVKTLEAAGTSISLKHYDVTDEAILADRIYYYRLKQTDCNGASNYFGIIDLFTSGKGFTKEITILPNPTTQYITIQSAKDMKKLEIYNTIGELVYDNSFSSFIDLGDLPPGIYYVKLTGTRTHTVKRIQKL